MCMQIRFQSAVMLMAKEIALSQPTFSIYEVTKSLRNKVNSGDIAFTDRTPEDVNGTNTFRVEHGDVKDIFQEVYRLRLTPFKKADVNPAGYMQFCLPSMNDGQTQVQAQVQQPSSTCSSGNTCTCTGQVVPAPISSKHPLADKLIKYLTSCGTDVTTKQIQSRFKGEPYTCEEFGRLAKSLGFKLDTSSSFASTWTVGKY